MIGKVVGVALAAEVISPGSVTPRNVARVLLWMGAALGALLALWITVTVVVVMLRPAPVSAPDCAEHVGDAYPTHQLCADSPDRR
jgi:hypothetical protein